MNGDELTKITASSPARQLYFLTRSPATRWIQELSCCSNYPFGFFNAYGNVARRDDVDYAMHVGEWPK